jgi:hypothetical protein
MQDDKGMQSETARQAYIRILREMADRIDSLPQDRRDVNLRSELINDGCLHGNVIPNGSGIPAHTIQMGIKPKGRLLLQQLQKEELDASVTQMHREAFQSLDRRGLSGMDDRSLAKWQSDYKQDEPEWRLAEHEWQRRLTAQQIKATIDAARWQAWFRILAVLISALLGTILTLVVQAYSK